MQTREQNEKTNLTIDMLNYKHQRNKFNTLLNDLRGKDITENKDDPRGLFKVLNEAQYKKSVSPMPCPDPDENISDSFNNFFSDKVNNVKQSLNEEDKDRHEITEELSMHQTEIHEFLELTPEQV